MFNSEFAEAKEIISKLDSLEQLLLKREKPFLTLQEACTYIGVARTTFYQYVSDRLIPCYRPQGRLLYFAVEDLDSFILNRKNRSRSRFEIEDDATTEVMTRNKG